MQRLRPLAVTGVVSAASVGLLIVAVSSGWLGPDTGRGANFCEVPHTAGGIRQPANSLSNVGFVVAGLLIAWHAGRTARHPLSPVMPLGLQTVYACVVVVLGPGSAAMHATQSSLGGSLDVLSMYLIAGLVFSYAWFRWVRRGTAAFAAVYTLCVVACELADRWPRSVPVVHSGGNLAFGLLLLGAVVLETLLWRRAETRRTIGFGFASLASMVTAFGIWIMSQRGWCSPESWLQGHAAWHLLCAVAAYFLYRLHASERRKSG